MTAVAFFADQNVIAPTHVALASTLAHWAGPDELDVYLFQSGWSPADSERLRSTAARSGGRCRLSIREINLSRVAAWKSLYGTLMPYGRLFLPDLLPDCHEVFYLDVDVIVEVDARTVMAASSSGGPVAALKAWDFEHSHDAALAIEQGAAMRDTYFHSGLLVLDLDWCRAQRVVQRFLDFGDRYAQRLYSHDQTVLNMVLRGHISAIPERFTTHLYPTSAAMKQGLAAVHSFCGSPKPFDPLGNILNANYTVFNEWLSRTALAGWSPNTIHELMRFRKNLRLLRPMVGTGVKMLTKRVLGVQ
jgi:lipopolysaccharide biosynthesis glycosyltransferase